MVKSIEHIITMGDSLSDRGTMDHRKLFGVIPMAGLSGLDGLSPLGRFGNGLVWDDDLAIELYGEFSEEYQRRKKAAQAKTSFVKKHDDIKSPEDIINEDVLGDDREVLFRNQDLFRNYNEGGLTSYDWSGTISLDISVDVKSRILANLDDKRALLLQDDKMRGIQQAHKDKTLVVEWSGANDLITIHSDLYKRDGYERAKEQVNRAIEARIRNLRELHKNGYCNFMLFNLPDLSLTPRFQNDEYLSKYVSTPDDYDAVRLNAHRISAYFNDEFARQLDELRAEFDEDCVIQLFDVNQTFVKAYEHPENYGLSSRNKTRGVSFDFPDTKHQVNAANVDGYFFWDDVHPTAKVHEVLAKEFNKAASEQFEFKAPHESLISIYREAYGQKFEDDKRGMFGFFRNSRINHLKPDLSLDDILHHGLKNAGHRTRGIMVELGWISKKGALVSDHPKLIEAYHRVMNLGERVELQAMSTVGGAFIN